MNKLLLLLLSIMCFMSVSVHADESDKNPLSKFLCDSIELLWPRWTSGKVTPIDDVDLNGNCQYGIRETNKEKIDAHNFVLNADGIPLVATAEGKYQPAGADTPAPDKVAIKKMQSVEDNHKSKVNKIEKGLHSNWAKDIWYYKSKWWIEKSYFGLFLAATIYTMVKGAQKLQRFLFEDQEGVDFDEFEDEAKEEVTQIVAEVTPLPNKIVTSQ